MAELAASVGNQLMSVDYDNNKRNDYMYNNDPDNDDTGRIPYSLARPGGSRGGALHGCLLDMNYPGEGPLEGGVVAVDRVRLADEDSSSPHHQMTSNTTTTTATTPCARCGLQLQQHHHHQGLLSPQQQLLVCGGPFYSEDGSLNDDIYPVGLRTPQ